MHLNFVLPRQVPLALVVFCLCGVLRAQEEDHQRGFSEVLSCPAMEQPADDGKSGGTPSAGTSHAPPFDYSLLKKKRQQLAAQTLGHSAVRPEFDPTAPRFGPLTGREKKLLTRALASEAARSADAAQFHNAKSLAIMGGAVGMIVWYGFFIVLGEVYFNMWQSEIGLGSVNGAFRYGTVCAVLMFFISMRDD